MALDRDRRLGNSRDQTLFVTLVSAFLPRQGDAVQRSPRGELSRLAISAISTNSPSGEPAGRALGRTCLTPCFAAAGHLGRLFALVQRDP